MTYLEHYTRHMLHRICSTRYVLDFWLRRVTSLRAPPALLLGYLWDKQPSAPFKPGNRALCRKMPVPGTAFEIQSEVTKHYIAQVRGCSSGGMEGV